MGAVAGVAVVDEVGVTFEVGVTLEGGDAEAAGLGATSGFSIGDPEVAADSSEKLGEVPKRVVAKRIKPNKRIGFCIRLFSARIRLVSIRGRRFHVDNQDGWSRPRAYRAKDLT
jgi:hypothetical protein